MTAFKVLRFLAGEPSGAETLRERWSPRPAAGAGAVEPFRVAVAEALALPGLPPPRFGAVVVQWFAGAEEALGGAGPGDTAACQVVAEEVVVRGGDYLDARWEAGGERYKMVSAARRSPGLTPEEFSARWRAEAGRLGAEAIPDGVRGLAYVQNHPVAGRDWPVDAVNEVWFDDVDDLRRRAEWFVARPVRPGGIFAPTGAWSLLVREVPVHPVGATTRRSSHRR